MSDHIDDADWTRLARYFARECSPEEQREIERWIEADAVRPAVIERLRKAWEQAIEPEAPYEVARAWGEVVRRKAARDVADGTVRHELGARNPFAEGSAGTRRQPVQRPARFRTRDEALRTIAPGARSRWSGVRVVAGIAAALLLVASALVVRNELSRSQLRSVPALAVLRSYATERGQRAEVQLTDGTRVILAPATTLRLLGDTTGGNRRFGAGASVARVIELDGEAWFSVTHDAAHPFEVRTAHGVARDLGTEFVVSSYPEVKGMRVAVQSGLVALSRAQRPAGVSSGQSSNLPADSMPLVTLGRSDIARVDTAGTVTLERGADLTPYLAWTRDSLVFSGTPLGDVALTLGRWYDLDVVLADSTIAGRHLALTLDTEAPDVALRLIALALDLRVERRGRTVFLYPLYPA